MDLKRKATPTSEPSSGLLLVKSLALLYLRFDHITNQIELEIYPLVVSQLLKWLNIICDRNIYISDKLRIKELNFPFFFLPISMIQTNLTLSQKLILLIRENQLKF